MPTFQTKTPKPASGVVKITPTMAEAWLGKNSHNRGLRNRQVDVIAQAIKRGEWVMNGDAIRFSKNDVLLDGQHRLWAIVESEMAVESLVITGLDDEAQETMDLGARRNLKDTLSLRGESNALHLSAALTYFWRFDNDQVRNLSAKPTIAQALRLLADNPDVKQACTAVARMKNLKRFSLSQGMLATVWLQFHRIDEEGAEYFFSHLVSGIDLKEGSPILALRRYLELNATSGAKSNAVMHHALFIKAWNAYREGRNIDKVMWKTTGVNAEAFPVAV